MLSQHNITDPDVIGLRLMKARNIFLCLILISQLGLVASAEEQGGAEAALAGGTLAVLGLIKASTGELGAHTNQLKALLAKLKTACQTIQTNSQASNSNGGDGSSTQDSPTLTGQHQQALKTTAQSDVDQVAKKATSEGYTLTDVDQQTLQAAAKQAQDNDVYCQCFDTALTNTTECYQYIYHAETFNSIIEQINKFLTRCGSSLNPGVKLPLAIYDAQYCESLPSYSP